MHIELEDKQLDIFLVLLIWISSILLLNSSPLIINPDTIGPRLFTVFSEMMILIPATVTLVAYKSVRDKAMLKLPFTKLSLVYGFAMGALGWMLGTALSTLIEIVYPVPEWYIKKITKLMPVSISDLLVLVAITFIVVAPAEELLFRGIIYGYVSSLYGFRKASLLSSFLFAVSHFDPWRFAGAFILGMLACYSMRLSNSIVSPVTLHATNNIITFITYYVASSILYTVHLPQL